MASSMTDAAVEAGGSVLALLDEVVEDLDYDDHVAVLEDLIASLRARLVDVCELRQLVAEDRE